MPSQASDERFQSMSEVRVALEQILAKAATSEPSIAVLPLLNLSADKENGYFSDGLAEEIINALTRIPGLKVTARTSAFAFRGKEQDVRGIAEALNVRAILEGSVRRAGNRIRVSAQLVNAADGYHLWSERYDGELADVFAVQDEIATAIARALQVKLSSARAERQRYTPNLPCYEAYLKALHEGQKVTPEGLARSQEWFERAIALDPNFALAHCMLGFHFGQLANYGFLPAHTAMRPLVRREAGTALAIDPSLPGGTRCWAWWRRSTTTTGRKRRDDSSWRWLPIPFRPRFAGTTLCTTCFPRGDTQRRRKNASAHSRRIRST